MIEHDVLQPREDSPTSPLGETTEEWFTEYDTRLYALWRVSIARQFHPDLLVKMSAGDLLFLAGQSSSGYPKDGYGGIKLEANKVDQNAARARAELSRRAARSVALRTVVTSVVCVFLAAGLGYFVGNNADADPSTPKVPAATTTTAP